MQEFLHYQTSFSIKSSAASSDEIYAKIQNLIKGWAIRKERRRDIKLHEGAGMIIENDYYSKGQAQAPYSSYKTEACYMDDGQAWAFEYHDSDAEINGRTWITQVGLRKIQSEQRVVFSIRLSYRHSFSLVQREDSIEKPPATIPRFVRAILEDLGAKCNFSMNSMDLLPYGSQCYGKISTREQAENVARFLEDDNRTIPVILFIGATPWVLEEAKALGHDLQGKSLVYLADYDPGIKDVFKKYHVGFDQCRVLLPFRRFGHSIRNHLLYHAQKTEEENDRTRKRIVRSQLSNYSVFEEGEVCTLSDIAALIRRETLNKLKKDIAEGKAASETKLDEWVQLATEYAGENEEKDKIISELRERNLELSLEMENKEKEASDKLISLQLTMEARHRKRIDAKAFVPSRFPSTIEELTTWVTKSGLFPHLAFSDRAWTPALTYKGFDEIGQLWYMLWHMNETLYKLKFEKGVADIPKEFSSISGLRFSRTEGMVTKNDAHLVAQRRFTYEGRSYEMWTHISWGTHEPKLIRIYFDWDNNSQRIIIGHVGPHMDNATTKTIH